MAQEQNIISARDIHKTYHANGVKVDALKGVDFAVKRGEMVAVMGPSGCGKTTLLNCLSGLDRFDQGEVEIDGTKLPMMSDDERTEYRARRMGFVFQLYNLLPALSNVENVEMPLLLSGVSSARSRKRATEVLNMVGLPGVAGRLPAELSGGQRQRVTIARALVNEPAIIWADEPTGDLDSDTTGEIMDLLCRLNKENQQTFVLVTHSDDVAGRADRIVRMRDGLIVDGR
jgi:ABC-type lipoprotein export system ATPase subunit